MTWRVQYTRTFLKELARLPSNVRKRVEAIAFGNDIKEDPFLRGKVQKLNRLSGSTAKAVTTNPTEQLCRSTKCNQISSVA